MIALWHHSGDAWRDALFVMTACNVSSWGDAANYFYPIVFGNYTFKISITSLRKWLPFFRQDLQMHFLVWKLLYFDSHFTEIHLQESHEQHNSIEQTGGKKVFQNVYRYFHTMLTMQELAKCIWNGSNFGFPGIFWKTHWGNGLKFCMLMYPDHFQNW